MKRRYPSPLLLLIFLALAACIVAAGSLLYRNQRESCRHAKWHELNAVADLKVSQISMWRRERLEDASVFYQNSAFSALLQRLIERTQDELLQKELRCWIGCVKASYHYDRVSLLDAACKEWISVPEMKTPHSPLTLQEARRSMRSGQIAFVDFYPDESTKRAYLRIFVPILDESSGGTSPGRPLGVLRMRINPEVDLYRFLQKWPTPSETAETLLIRREGNEAVFLNELRFQKDTALTLRVPLDSTDRPVVNAAIGQEGIVEGIDYRDVPVLAVVRAVPDSPWFLVAKMDASEVYAPMRERLWLIIFFVAVVLFALAVAGGFLWQQQHAALYREKYESEEKFRLHVENSFDVIFTLDKAGTFLFVSPAWERHFGYPVIDVQGKPFAPFLHPDDVEPYAEYLKRVMSTGQGETSPPYRVKRADGEWRWFLANGTRYVDTEGRFQFIGVGRDITGRKELERRQNLSAEVLGILNDSTTLSDAINRTLAAIRRTTGFDAVGIRLRKSDDFPYASQSGFSRDFLLGENSLMARDSDGKPCRDEDGNIRLECTCGLVLSGKTDPTSPLFTPGGSFWTNDSLPLLDIPATEDPRLHPRNRCIHEGFRSVALIPIRAGREIIGLLQINDRKSDCFTLEMVHFYEGIGANIGMALMRLDTEEALRQSERRFMDVLYASSDAILLIDGERFVDCNEATAKMLGYSNKQDFLMTHPSKLSPQTQLDGRDSFEKAEEMMRAAFQKGYHRFEWMHRKANGEDFPVEVSLTPITFRGKTVLHCLWRDLTEKKRAEERQLLLLKQLREAQKCALAASNAKSTFLANMSHEIRTPMTAILGFADILAANPTPEETAEAVQIIRDNGCSLLELINGILDLSKIEAGKYEVQHVACSPRKIVADVLSTMNVRAVSKGLSMMHETIEPVPERIWSDPARLRQILVNLVGNAIKFTETGSVHVVMQIDASPDGQSRLRFDVIDTGIGMTAEQSALLFQPFTQVDTSVRRRFGGTGLGLAISKRLAEMLDGTIEVISEPGQGSTFRLIVAMWPPEESLPQAESPESLARPLLVPPSDQQALHCRILLAEDGLVNQRLVTLVLTKAGGEVVVTDNGQTAVELALTAWQTDDPFTVVLMDMLMPIMDGYEATTTLRNAGYDRPIIALTAHAMAEDRQKCLDVGCDDYISKPIDQTLLLDVVARYMRQQVSHGD